nr:slipin family protein [Pseudohongiella acticola]
MEVFSLVLMAIAIGLLFSTFNILKEYERGVIFMLGRFHKVKGPGLIIVIPIIQQMVKTSLRTAVWDIPSQDLITKDNVSVKVNAVLYFRVVDPQKAVINVEDFMEATSQLAQTTLRSVLGQHELDELLSERERLNRDVQDILDDMTDGWGIKVSNVEIKHVDIDESMIRAIAQQAEAERSRRAKVIHAQGEFEASQKLVEAASQLATQPASIQLRYLQTLTEIAGEQNSTIVFPLPMNLMEGLGKLGAALQTPDQGQPAPAKTPTAPTKKQPGNKADAAPADTEQ